MTPVAAAAPTAAPTAAPASTRCFNCSAGPGILPEDVLRQVQRDIWDIAGSGVGILEHSHRGKVVDRIFEECIADCRAIANIPAGYQVLFLTGGASSQFHMIPMNFLAEDDGRKSGRTADYLVTGVWAKKAAEEAPRFGNVHIAGSSKETNHNFVPTQEQLKFSDRPAYVHYCGNNTIYGTQFHYVPRVPEGVPLVCDLSSEFYSRPLDVSPFSLIYAGAQKNIGPAGVTLVIIRDELIERGNKNLPTLLQYRSFPAEMSRPNTPPVFPIYVMGQVFKWLLRNGGLPAIQRHNEEKAKLIYDVLDSSSFYRGHARADSRSLMNVTFRLPTEELEDAFVKEAKKEAGIDGLKGHRSVGGIRASIYNAFPKEGCAALAQFMREFERKNG